jgi:hypothetical protein
VSVTACVVVSVTACVVAGDLTHPGTDATTRVRHDAKPRLEDGGDDGDVGSVPELKKKNGMVHGLVSADTHKKVVASLELADWVCPP